MDFIINRKVYDRMFTIEFTRHEGNWYKKQINSNVSSILYVINQFLIHILVPFMIS